MNRHDLRLLQAAQSGPAVTITLPTHRTSPDNQQDPIRLRNLLRDAAERLTDGRSARDVQPLLDRLQAAAAAIDLQHALDGLAIFVSDGVAQSFKMPFPVPERVVIDDTFLTRDLVRAMNRTVRCFVLTLSEKPTRLYEAAAGAVVEVEGDGFPMTHEGPGGSAPLPGGHGVNASAQRDERHRQFFRAADTALSAYLADDPLPVIVAGVDRYLAFFDEVTDNKRAVIGTVEGNFDSAAPHQVAAAIQPVIDRHLAAEKVRALAALDEAVGAQRASSTIGEVWRMANEGRGHLLLVEHGYQAPGTLDDSGNLHKAADGADAAITDAVDDVIETVLEKGGEVVFVDDGALAQHSRIAMVRRY